MSRVAKNVNEETRTNVSMTSFQYRVSTLGKTLEEVLHYYLNSGLITKELVDIILRLFDKSICERLRQLRTRAMILSGGRLRSYRYYDNVWTILIDNPTIRQNITMETQKIKIVACTALP